MFVLFMLLIEYPWKLTNTLIHAHTYFPSDPYLAGPTSLYIVKSADQQDHSKNQHFQPHT